MTGSSFWLAPEALEHLRVLRRAAATAGDRAHDAVRRFGDFDRRRAGAWGR